MNPPETDIAFICPECDSSYYRSTYKVENSKIVEGTLVRHCRGNDDDGCGFTWPQQDDWKHFAVVTTTRFSSAEEYEAAHEVERQATEDMLNSTTTRS